MTGEKITAERLRHLLTYSPETGEFRWRPKRDVGRIRGRYMGGDVAGSINEKQGRWYVGVDYRKYQRSRLAWLYCTGQWPNGQIDHRNCNTADDRISNLRIATQQQQQANTVRSIANTSGYKGVTWHKARGKWQAFLKVGRKARYLGLFPDPAEAHRAYMVAAESAFGEFARGE